jgi:hypothetical protein
MPATTPEGLNVGEVTTPYPTINNISILANFSGDTNGNASATVRFQKKGSNVWKAGHQLLRVAAGTSVFGHTWTNRFAGSVFDVDENSTYVLEVAFSDPDGGSVTKTTEVTTRKRPQLANGDLTKYANPGNIANTINNAAPGETIMLAAGTYPSLVIDKQARFDKPLIIRSTEGAVINGSVTLSGSQYVYVAGLRILGGVDVRNTSNVAIMKSQLEPTGTTANAYGIRGYKTGTSRPENLYIADNTIIGKATWTEECMSVSGSCSGASNEGEGIMITGPGHVIENNYIKGFRDNISFMEGSSETSDQFSIDILNNDLVHGLDDAIEADSCYHNCRIMRNRITNAFIGISSQPSLGGPTYFIRNLQYNVTYLAYKLNNRSAGNYLYHNTTVKAGNSFEIQAGNPVSFLTTRNNIFIGGTNTQDFNSYSPGNGSTLFGLSDVVTSSANLDYDLLGTTVSSYSIGRIGGLRFANINELRASGIEKNIIVAGTEIFARAVSVPTDGFFDHSAPNLSIRGGSVAENSAEIIANINDTYAGSAPDRGALEIGASPIVFGPRP